jgi:hypothetical protein
MLSASMVLPKHQDHSCLSVAGGAECLCAVGRALCSALSLKQLQLLSDANALSAGAQTIVCCAHH